MTTVICAKNASNARGIARVINESKTKIILVAEVVTDLELNAYVKVSTTSTTFNGRDDLFKDFVLQTILDSII